MAVVLDKGVQDAQRFPRARCEPFRVHRCEKDRHGRATTWSFCKTGRAPYDLCVQVALIVLRHHLGDLFTVGSDGCDGDWQQARRFCQEHLGYGQGFKLSPKDIG
ncbi:MAG: hypothetical protein WCK05_04515 [Planctomycetota bacterium]